MGYENTPKKKKAHVKKLGKADWPELEKLLKGGFGLHSKYKKKRNYVIKTVGGKSIEEYLEDRRK